MFTLPELPYAEDALAPHMSADTMKFHYGKHHKAYVDKLNGLLDAGPLSGSSLEEIIVQTSGDTTKSAIFNNAAQAWNHDFFWKSLSPDGGGLPTGDIERRIIDTFGDAPAFAKAFSDAATAHFGSGWAWLVLNDDELEILTTHDADLPLAHGSTALLTCDLWEHAYYLDYQNQRPAFIQAFLDHLVNWDFANANLAAAKVPEPA